MHGWWRVGRALAIVLVVGLIGMALSRHDTRNIVILLVSLIVIDLAIVGSWFSVEKRKRRSWPPKPGSSQNT